MEDELIQGYWDPNLDILRPNFFQPFIQSYNTGQLMQLIPAVLSRDNNFGRKQGK